MTEEKRTKGFEPKEPLDAAGFVPCNANGNVYLKIEASGNSTARLWIQIYGYVL